MKPQRNITLTRLTLFMVIDGLAVSFECTPVREIFIEDDDSPLTVIVNAIADLEGVEPTDLPPLHNSIEPMSLCLMLEHSRVNQTSEMGICFSYTGWNVFVRNDGTVYIGDPDRKSTPTPMF